jgi:hypothetical protein
MGQIRNSNKLVVRNLEGTSSRKLEGSVKEIECKSLDWIQLAQDKMWWWVYMGSVMNLRVPQDPENIVSS